MKQPVGERLKQRGLDIQFLAWLEGEQQRLPRLDGVRAIKDADFIAALRAVAWLGQQFIEPELIAPATAKQWRTRYDFLERSLHSAVRWSMVYHITVAEDLEALEGVLEKLFPSSS